MSKNEFDAKQKLQNQGFYTFLPWLKALRVRRGEQPSSLVPIIPGYMFVELDSGNHDTSTVLSTRGVLKLVGQGDSLKAVAEDLKNSLPQNPLKRECTEKASLNSPALV